MPGRWSWRTASVPVRARKHASPAVQLMSLAIDEGLRRIGSLGFPHATAHGGLGKHRDVAPRGHWNDDLRDGHVEHVAGAGEIKHHPLESAYQIPVDHLRENLAVISKDKPLALLCQSGQRSYIAQRILKQSGFKDVFNITGGWLGVAAQQGKWS